MPTYRARFDATVTFTNGGGLQAQGFIVDVGSADVTTAQIGELFLDSLGLLMAGEVQLSNVEIIEAAHKGTRGGPAAERAPSGKRATYIELSQEGAVNHELSGFSLERTVDLPAVVVRLEDSRRLGIDAAALATYDVRGKAVLLQTGDDARFGTPEYVEQSHYLTRDGAEWLIGHGALLVGIDAATIDDPTDATRPAHTLLLGAGIAIVEHLTNLAEVPPSGALFTATAPRIEGARAYAKVLATDRWEVGSEVAEAVEDRTARG
ncbi:cyclase family protein [Kribbella sp. NPDC058245]|uniref:cyclase family protein n=1 Tax=Kribbella sp. NPDC058245 TaxID=3346399 RepID=UPI0036E4357B